MAELTIFGTGDLDTGAGYATGNYDPIIVGTRFVVLDTDDAQAIAPRIFPAPWPGYDLTGNYGYLFNGTTLLASKALSGSIQHGFWNEVLLDLPYPLSLGVGLIVAWGLPSGGWAKKESVFASGTVGSVDNPDRLAALANSSGGNGVFFEGVQGNWAAPVVTAWSSFNATHYGVDIRVDDLTPPPIAHSIHLSGGASNAIPAASIGGALSSTAAAPGLLDTVTFEQSVSGVTEYRCVYLRNDEADVTAAGSVYITQQPTTGTISLGAAPESAGTPAEVIANDSTAPTGVSFSQPTSGAPLSLGSLSTSQYKGVWIKRVIPSETPAGSYPTGLMFSLDP